MKKGFLFLAVAGVAAVVFLGCNEREKLVAEVAGSWATEQQMIANDDQGQTSGCDMISFSTDASDKGGGTVSIVSTLSLTRAANGLASVESPFSVSVAATSSISGRFSALDDDELLLQLDGSTLKVNVDDDAVVLVANPLSGDSRSEIDSLKPGLAKFYQTELTNIMRSHYGRYSRLDDVKVKDNGSILQIEVGDKDYYLQRQ